MEDEEHCVYTNKLLELKKKNEVDMMQANNFSDAEFIDVVNDRKEKIQTNFLGDNFLHNCCKTRIF